MQEEKKIKEFTRTLSARSSGTKIVTGKVRLHHIALSEPVDFYGKLKFGVTLSWKNSDVDTTSKVEEAIKLAYRNGVNLKLFKDFYGDGVLALENLKTPLNDGNSLLWENSKYKNHMFLRANSLQKPGLINIYGKPAKPEEIYEGVFGRCSFRLFPYRIVEDEHCGIAATLINVQVFGYGEKVDSSANARDDFSDSIDDDKDDDEEIDVILDDLDSSE